MSSPSAPATPPPALRAWRACLTQVDVQAALFALAFVFLVKLGVLDVVPW